ncbi:MAG: hypothetical protein IT373_30350, partial [Polyangiaceae bacterium]|nr:hypothetical protein [Polyangiaceae bacterium]
MRVLWYAGMDPGKHRGAVEKVCTAIERDDFRSADVKKLSHGGLYRAKLDAKNRLLLRFVEHGAEKACLVLELVPNHAYDRARFLRGAPVDLEKLEAESEAREPASEASLETSPLRYLHPERREFHHQDKPISFDDAQARVLATPTPLFLVGTAGSGKTALVLEKLRLGVGDALYVTQSPYLAESARALYFAHGFEDEGQSVDFLSHRELVESIRVPAGRPVAFRDFQAFFERHRATHRFTDAHQVYEELRGVIGADPEGPLSLDAYLELGVRQSIYAVEERRALHALFDKYRAFLAASALYDPNLVAQAYLCEVEPRYDFVAVDEVQDLTRAELALVLACLRRPGAFVLAGDANQIVHPNFFSWAGLKRMFIGDAAAAGRQRIELLDVNFRNARAVTTGAKRLLRVKQARFGSIDRESNTLVRPVADEAGTVELLPDTPTALAELDRKTGRSARVAVLVLRDEHKAEARRHFRTPLLFSVHEAKGLEYETVVAFRFVSSERERFGEVCAGVGRADLEGAELPYGRAADRSDKALEVHKFYVNALYVALTRAVRHAYLVESESAHPLLGLLDVGAAGGTAAVEVTTSSLEEWQSEAERLERQGKRDQADAIRRDILHVEPVPWTVVDAAAYRTLADKAFMPRSPFTKAKQQLYGFACVHDAAALAARLARRADYKLAEAFERDAPQARAKVLLPYQQKRPDEILGLVARHGVDFRTPAALTPLMSAVAAGNVALVEALLARGARRELVDPFGRTAAHWALLSARRNEAYARGPLGALWELVVPSTLDIQVDGRLFKIGREQAEHFYLLLSLTLWPGLMRSSLGRFGGITAGAFEQGGLRALPPNVVSPARRRRPYVSSVLARCEVGSKYTPSRKLFVRERHGHYVPNPALLLRVPGAGDV